MEALTDQISILVVEAEYILDKEIGNQFCGSDTGGDSSSALDEEIGNQLCGSNSDGGFILGLDALIHKIESIDKELNKIVIEEIDSGDLTPLDYSDEVIEKKSVDSSDLDSLAAATSSSRVELVGFDDRVSWVIDKLTDDETSLQVIPIVGMGGIGKTTLARSVYDHPNIQRSFDRRMRCTISQNYDVKQILQVLLEEDKSYLDIPQLGQLLHTRLHHRRYLIIMDDVWDVEACESLKMHLPENQNRSRVIVTTRDSNVASSLCCERKSCVLDLLDNNKSWDLLQITIFGSTGCCPDELQEIGKDIARNCEGLPLSIVTIGGVLSKSDMTVKFWRYVAANVWRLVSSAESNHCLKVLSLSYHCLPIHLKPCFLYFRNFVEDERIVVKDLIRSWIVEGFVEQTPSETMKDTATGYLKDLVARNLIMILTRSHFTGNSKECGVHDLVREVCISESSKLNFFSTPRTGCRRLRSDRKLMHYGCPIIYRPKLVTIFDIQCYTTLRLLHYQVDSSPDDLPPLKMSHLWNLQFLHLTCFGIAAMFDKNKLADIWELSQLRDLDMGFFSLPNPTVHSNPIILSELRKLHVSDLELNTTVVERMRNLKKLNVMYTRVCRYSLHLLECFSQLESVGILSFGNIILNMNMIKFPMSLKRLVLRGVCFNWDEMMPLIGSLLNLQVLKLENIEVRGISEWNVENGGFPSLKILAFNCTSLCVWRAESHHFPVLEKLMIQEENELEIPSDIGFIDTLNSIRLTRCSDRTCKSVVQLLEEQREYANQILQVLVDDKMIEL